MRGVSNIEFHRLGFLVEYTDGNIEYISIFDTIGLLFAVFSIILLVLPFLLMSKIIIFIGDVIVSIGKTIANCIKFVVNAAVDLCSTMMYYIEMV